MRILQEERRYRSGLTPCTNVSDQVIYPQKFSDHYRKLLKLRKINYKLTGIC